LTAAAIAVEDDGRGTPPPLAGEGLDVRGYIPGLAISLVRAFLRACNKTPGQARVVGEHL